MDSKEFVKRVTTVPIAFIDELFEFYNEHTLQTDFVINLDAVAKWLQTRKSRLIKTLRESYKLNIDYKIQPGVKNPNQKDRRNNNYKSVVITPDCFKRMCMLSKAKNADMVRTYFIEVESLFLKHKDQIIEGLKMDIQRLEKQQSGLPDYKKGEGYIYVLKASPYQDSLVKIGRTKDLKKRLQTYMTGQAHDIDVLYVYKTSNVYGAEQCIKGYLQNQRYRKYKEVYKVDLDYVKRLINRCDNVDRMETVYQRRKALTHTQEGGYYVALFKDELESTQ